MRHTARIELANNDELVAVKLGFMNPEDVRRITVEDALVDTGATRLGLPPSLINSPFSKPHASAWGCRKRKKGIHHRQSPLSLIVVNCLKIVKNTSHYWYETPAKQGILPLHDFAK